MPLQRIEYHLVNNPPYKYQLDGGHSRKLIGDFPDVSTGEDKPWVRIQDGVIHLRNGYQWDGPSGPAIDTANWMWASLVHDALYQLICEERLPVRMHVRADDEMRKILAEAGMNRIRRAYSWLAVRTFGGLVARYRINRRKKAKR